MKKKAKQQKKPIEPQKVRYLDFTHKLDTHSLENLIDLHKQMLDVQMAAIKQHKINCQTLLSINSDNVTVLDSHFQSTNN